MQYILALDQGTTSSRAILFDAQGRSVKTAQKEFRQIFPQPGWVEHDANEIWNTQRQVIEQVLGLPDSAALVNQIAGIAITNQRETTVLWDRLTGEPLANAIVWQDRRTADLCDTMRTQGHTALLQQKTGLVLDAYFSATKLAWLLDQIPGARARAERGELAFGTIDTWLLWKLTAGKVHATDPSNASRTLLFNVHTLQWDDELCGIFGVPTSALADVRPSSGRFGLTDARSGVPAGIPISGIAGDQQAALFGQACLHAGMAKNTYGTGSFVLMNVGSTCPPPSEGMLTTVAWTLSDGSTAYALEGAIFVTGAAVQWLRDGLGLIGSASEIGPLAASVPDTNGAYVVPALTGLGSPWWDPYARGTIVGISRGVSRAHLARAVVESMAYQTRDAVEAMSRAAGTPLSALRVDGGAAVMDLLLQLQADQLGVPVQRPVDSETTALGAAFLAGLAEGVWPSLASIEAAWSLDVEFAPATDRTFPDIFHSEWLRAVERSRNWAR